MQLISGPDPIFEPKPLTAIRYGEESLEVDLVALEVDLIEDLLADLVLTEKITTIIVIPLT